MKKLMFALSLMLVAGLPAAFATGEKEVDPRVLITFDREFSFAKNVKWEVKEKYTEARFIFNDQVLLACFTEEGELISTARNILFMQLPLSVIKSLQESYAEAELSGITEVSKNGETSYYMQADIKNKSFLLHAWPTGNVLVTKKLKS